MRGEGLGGPSGLSYAGSGRFLLPLACHAILPIVRPDVQ